MENSTYGVIDAVRTKYMENLLNSSDGTVDLGGTENNVTSLVVSGEKPTAGTWTIDNSAVDSTGKVADRGIKVTGVKFDSMKGYTCSNTDANGKITAKVTCKK